MRHSGVLAGLVLFGAAAGALAQDPQPSASPEPQEEARPEPVRKIKVLQDPHDIASFYRSSQGNGYFGMMPADPLSNQYPIANYYRNHQGNAGGGPGYGYGAGYAGYGAGYGVGYGVGPRVWGPRPYYRRWVGARRAYARRY